MQKKISPLALLWLFNLALFLSYSIGLPGVSFLKSSVLEYSNIKSDPFDGAISPVAYVPDWTRPGNTNKAKRYEDFLVSDFVEIPDYDTTLMSDDSGKKNAAILTRYSYPVVYMGSYRGNYVEYDGSHLGVDIRAPLGTPILATANGVVVKVKNDETGDGKYVILRHDDVDTNGVKETYYSIYEHMEEIIAVEGTKVKRGDVIGKVGMTGITTTPHVHFQIDKSDAPFHGYWPYSFKEAADVNLDFFGAVNVGLGKENAIRYTINPMDFIKTHRFLSSAGTEKVISVAGNSTPIPLNSAPATPTVNNTSVLVADTSNSATISTTVVTGTTNTQSTNITPVDTTTQTASITNTSSEAPVVTTPTPVVTPVVRTIDPAHPFADISTNSTFFAATKYLFDKGVTKGYDDGTFRADSLLSRGETILLYGRLFGATPLDSAEWEFSDVLPSDELYGYLARAATDGIVTHNRFFRPNDSLTRAEAVSLLVRSAKLTLSSTRKQTFKDVKLSHTHFQAITTLTEYLGIRGANFLPDQPITRGELAKMLYLFNQKYQK